jgi:hypothetical protein
LIGPRGSVRRSLTWPRDWPGPHGSLQVAGWLTVGGQRLSDQDAQKEINRIPVAVLYRSGDRAWLAAHRVSYWIGYQPGSRYWLFQCLFAAILLAFIGAAGLIAVWLAGWRR